MFGCLSGFLRSLALRRSPTKHPKRVFFGSIALNLLASEKL